MTAAANDGGMPPVLIYAPGRDGELSCRMLGQAGHACHRCANEQELLLRLRDDVSALLIAEELLDEGLSARLRQAVQAQPAWSDLPVFVVVMRNHDGLLRSLQGLGNVAVLTRPMVPTALASAVALGIRARRRQFEVRDLLESQQEQARRKDEFLAMLAHELRNPLAPVRYAAHMILSDDLPQTRRVAIARLMEQQVAHMGRLIEQLLDVTRVNRGLIELRLEPTDLGQVVRQSVEAHSVAARARNIELHCEGTEPAWIDGDATRLKQVCDNLLENAIKFSFAGATVRVRLRQVAGAAVVEVVDEGDGIDPKDLAQIFEPFVQGDRSLDRSAGGLGLGLSMVRGLVQLHGGEVEAHSHGKGKGSSFTVRIPLRADADDAGRDAGPGADDAGSRRVLLVEDNLDAAETLKMVLELAGHRVAHEAAGDLAVEAARSGDFDAVICDIGLPGLNGYEVAQALRAMPRHASTFLVAVTGYGGHDSHAAALAAGFDEHWAKPVAPDQLLDLLERPDRARKR